MQRFRGSSRIKARQELAKQSVAVRVVSVPSCFKFWQTSQEYQREILCKNKGNGRSINLL